jgi:hypothetical protein
MKNGKIIKMLVDPRDLDNSTAFWKTEKEVGEAAFETIKDLRDRKVYDYHGVNPDPYNYKQGKEWKGNAISIIDNKSKNEASKLDKNKKKKK